MWCIVLDVFTVLITHPSALQYYNASLDSTASNVLASMIRVASSAAATAKDDAHYQLLCFCVNLCSTPDAIPIALPYCQPILQLCTSAGPASAGPATTATGGESQSAPIIVLPILTRHTVQRLLSNLSLLVGTIFSSHAHKSTPFQPILQSLIAALLTTLRTETEATLFRDATAALATLISEASGPARAYCFEVGAKSTLEVLLSRSDKEAAHYAYCAIKLLS